MLSKSLIQFSINVWGCVPSLLSTMVEVMKKMVTSFKRSHACTATLSAPNLAAGHHWPMPLLESPGYSWASLGQSLVRSLLLSPGSWCTQDSVCALQESVSQILCKSGSSMVGLMAMSSKRAYAIPKSAAPKAPDHLAVHCWPIALQETLKHRSVSVNKKGFLSDQCKKVEGKKRMEKTRYPFKKIRDTKGNVSCKGGHNKGQKWYGPNRRRTRY